MSAIKPVQRKMTLEEFFEWESRQEEKWELIDGVPYKRWDLRGMAGGTAEHAAIAVNVLTSLRSRLKGRPCRPFNSDFGVKALTGANRFPDVTVDCGRRERGDRFAAEPQIVLEVLSPSNTFRQQLDLLDDYQSIATLDTIVFVSSTEPALLVWRRGEAGWTREDVVGLETELTLPSIGCELPLTEIYDEIDLPDPPALGRM